MSSTAESHPSRRARWIEQPDHREWLRGQTAAQLRFARGFAHPEGGAWYLDDVGAPDASRPVATWITARMAHVYSLGHLAGLPGCRPLAAAAIGGLRGRLRDDVNGGWFASLGPADERDETKAAYAHAFVVFASSSATMAGVPGARELLDEALAVLDERFWEEGPGLHRDSAVADWSTFSDYRGVNANMHAVEALLSAADTTGDARWLERAARITSTVLGWAAGNAWRIPEHFDPAWTPLLEHHRDQPDHPFEPYGATVGHGLEWARLALHVRAALGDAAPESLLDGAKQLFARAVADGWAADGADGFVYTTDWSGVPVVRQRMHWVAAEAISAAAALSAATGDPAYDAWYRTWWDYAVGHLVDDDGSWRHELDPANRPAGTVWPGRPDLYHSIHAVLLQRLPLAPSAPTALARGLLR
ncbi:AGE family epimerase/isomerase [Actinotalea sp.]|uniref:AGE family epimerase/isomerase n=1 Tax=Actinotalea sp. TaxID=1872145 RepID=UPI002B80A1E2|nr:AGE family epimerase/isomerase [Actinotalea sp.]HQY34540.1 AGE family epimerase/isomerase [Actinotalea sp.]HRA51400.1 AGE family epimerase/isomerase [Actinotalea sp.]